MSICFTREEGQFLLEHGEDGGRFHVDVGHLRTRKTNGCFSNGFVSQVFKGCTQESQRLPQDIFLQVAVACDHGR